GPVQQHTDPSAPRPRVGRVRRGRLRFDRAERYDGRASRRDPPRAGRGGPCRDPDRRLLGQVRERLLWSLPGGGGVGAEIRQPLRLPDGPGQLGRGAARGGARSRGGGRHGHGEAGASLPRRDPAREGPFRRPGRRVQRLGRVRDDPGGRGERLARRRAGGPGDPDVDPPRRSRRDPYLLREGDRPGPGKGGSMKEARVLPKTSESESLHRCALGLFPGGVNSPVLAFQGVGGSPRVMVSARGAVMRDADGNQLLDYVLGWGPLLLGHAHADVVKAVERQAREGTLYGATTPLEIELADRVQRFYPAA